MRGHKAVLEEQDFLDDENSTIEDFDNVKFYLKKLLLLLKIDHIYKYNKKCLYNKKGGTRWQWMPIKF